MLKKISFPGAIPGDCQNTLFGNCTWIYGLIFFGENIYRNPTCLQTILNWLYELLFVL